MQLGHQGSSIKPEKQSNIAYLKKIKMKNFEITRTPILLKSLEDFF